MKYKVSFWLEEYHKLNSKNMLAYAATRGENAQEMSYEILADGVYKLVFKFEIFVEADNMLDVYEELVMTLPSDYADNITRIQVKKVMSDESVEEV